MRTYVGIHLVEAEPEKRDGREGYRVKNPSGYVSWSPKAAFERAYLCLGETKDLKEAVEKKPHCAIKTHAERAFESFLEEGVDRMANPGTDYSSFTLATRTGWVERKFAYGTGNASQGRREVEDEQRFEALEQRLRSHITFVLFWAKLGLKAYESRRRHANDEGRTE